MLRKVFENLSIQLLNQVLLPDMFAKTRSGVRLMCALLDRLRRVITLIPTSILNADNLDFNLDNDVAALMMNVSFWKSNKVILVIFDHIFNAFVYLESDVVPLSCVFAAFIFNQNSHW